MVRKSVWLTLVPPLVVLVACGGGGQQNQSTASGSASGGNVEEMGPMGGGNATTPTGDNGPVGQVDNGNVAPGDVFPNNPREGSVGAVGNSGG